MKLWLFLPLLLSGCAALGWGDAPPRACPQVAIIDGLALLNQVDGDLLLAGIEGDCTASEAGQTVRFTVTVRATADALRDAAYFVAIVDGADKIHRLQRYPAQLAGEREASFDHVIHLEVAAPSSYRLLLGWQLTPDQLATARARRDRSIPDTASQPLVPQPPAGP